VTTNINKYIALRSPFKVEYTSFQWLCLLYVLKLYWTQTGNFPFSSRITEDPVNTSDSLLYAGGGMTDE